MAKAKSGIKAMKLIAIKKECYAIAQVNNTSELKQKYQTLCQKLDLRRRSNWEYVLDRIQADGDWMGIKISDVEKGIHYSKNKTSKSLIFHPERVMWDKAAENDD